MAHSYLDLPRGRIAYDVTGDGPLILLAPGMGDVRATFRMLAPLLVENGYRVATTDLRGHGDSSTDWGSYTNADAGADLAALIQHLGTPAIVLGHSFSGGSAVWLAAEEPSLISQLILIDAFTRPTQLNPVMKCLVRAILSTPTLWGMYYASLYKGGKPADFPEHLKALKTNLREPGRMAAVRAMGLDTKTVLKGKLSRITAPTLILNGSKDPDFPDPHVEAETIAAELGGMSETVMIDGAGHYPHAERPETVAHAVLGFLQEHADA